MAALVYPSLTVCGASSALDALVSFAARQHSIALTGIRPQRPYCARLVASNDVTLTNRRK